MAKDKIIKIDDIQSRIVTIRKTQVMFDNDLAEFFGIETKVLNQAVKRNIERFPKEFMFKLSDEEYEFLRSQSVTLEMSNSLRFQNGTLGNKSLRSQNATLNLRSHNLTPSGQSNNLRSQSVTLEDGRGKHRKYLPYVFTEQGVAMLSAVLKSETAIKMSVQIMNAFVAMRHFLLENAQIFKRMDSIELKQFETDNKLDNVLNALSSQELQPKQGIFYDGQIFDAYKFACDIIRKANKSLILIDNFVNESVLEIMTKRRKNVSVTIYTNNITAQLKLDLKKHNEQYQPIEIMEFSKSHDRFLIVDDKTVYHIGASLKDLGKKWFAFSKMEMDASDILKKLL